MNWQDYKLRADLMTYLDYLDSRGMTEEEAMAEVLELPYAPVGPKQLLRMSMYVAPSQIHQHGLFTGYELERGDDLGEVLDPSGALNELGRFVNHSARPNAVFCFNYDRTILTPRLQCFLLTVTAIYPGEEITACYFETDTARRKATFHPNTKAPKPGDLSIPAFLRREPVADGQA